MFYLENKFQKLDSAVNCDISKVNLPLFGENSALNFPVIKKKLILDSAVNFHFSQAKFQTFSG